LPSDGYYVVVRRFSSKEEKRRIFASVVYPQALSERGITFENHLNYYHINRHGFDKETAYGLMAYLNSQVLDGYFRRFSGHTQVNVSDLKKIPYPSPSILCDLGRAVANGNQSIDELVNQTIIGVADVNA
jgi:adenine-specific DNA-methyltransferase